MIIDVKTRQNIYYQLDENIILLLNFKYTNQLKLTDMLTKNSKEDINDLKKLKKQFIRDLKQAIREFKETVHESETSVLNQIRLLIYNYDSVRIL